MRELLEWQFLGGATGNYARGHLYIFVKIYTADVAVILTVEPPHSETAAKSWDRQSSFTKLTE
jgi:hypothetical protein